MRRYEESEKNRLKESIKLGEDNLECLRYMNAWCKYVKIKPESSGLYAEMTGLPIGSYSIACPYTQGGYSSMNLRWIFSDFLTQYCASCSHHHPNGNTTWGQKIINEYQENQQKQEKIIKQETARISERLTELRLKSQDINSNTEPESQRIVKFLETIFAENIEERKQSAEYLKNSARLAADLFTNEAINLILELAISKEFSELLLPVCVELAHKRNDLTSDLLKVALNNIKNNLNAELSAFILVQLDNSVIYPLDEIYIKSLLFSQDHYRSITYYDEKRPSYIHSTAILIRCYDAEPNSLETIIRQELKNENEYCRIQLCGALALIQQERPQLVLTLLNELLQSLEIYEYHSSMDSPSKHIIPILQSAFKYNPEYIDEFLAKSMTRVRSTIQEEIIQVYREQFFDKNLAWDEKRELHKRIEISEQETIAIKRLLTWAKDEQLEIDIRNNTLEALEMACKYATSGIIEQFDSLLGYYALICQQKEPPKSPPKILLLNELHQDQQVEKLNDYNQLQNWKTFKNKIVCCLNKLCETNSSKSFDSISDCLNNYEQLDESFKACCISLLGEIGKDHQLQPRVLPLIWRSLMDFNSIRIRAKAIKALSEMFRYSDSKPPENLIDVIIIFLSDRFVVIHKTALRLLSSHFDWFNEKQSFKVLEALAWQLQAYSDEKYQLDDICDGIFSISRKDEILKIIGYNLVKSIFPTGEKLVDENIAKKLMSFCKPTEPLAKLISKDIAFYLGRYDRDRYNWYGHSIRGNMFKWLHELPMETYHLVADDILNSAKEMALRDDWEACHFASFFAHYHAFNYEKIVLETAANALPEEPRHKNFKTILQQLAIIAKANLALQCGDIKNAEYYFTQGKQEI